MSFCWLRGNLIKVNSFSLRFSIDPIFLLPVAGFNSKVTWWKFEKRSGNILLKDGEHGEFKYLHKGGLEFVHEVEVVL